MRRVLGLAVLCAAVTTFTIVLAARHEPSAQAAPGDTVADMVYGQTGFNTGTLNCAVLGPITASSLCSPQSVAIDGAGRLWVADSYNHRVLEYDTPLSITTPNRVFGQGGSFTTGTCNKGGVSANSLCYPAQVTVDANGNLWVADSGNNRVLEYDNPISTDTVADRVFGQFNSFTSNTYNNGGTSANSLWNPTGVAVDSAGNLFVADRWNYRILEYNTPLSSDTVADRVFGQGGNLNSGVQNLGGVSANSLATLLGLGIDASDNLYVADEGNNRILEYLTPISTDTTADRVFGQFGSFTSNVANNGGVSAASSYVPTGITVDLNGNVYVSETGNERGLEYDNPASTDTIADQVFGHAGSFTASTNNDIGLNASSLADPWGIAIDHACHLWIADMSNNRVLEYDSPPPGCGVAATFTPTSTVCPVTSCTATPTATDTWTPTVTPTPTATPLCVPTPLNSCTPTPSPTPCTGGPPPPAPCTPTPTATPCTSGPPPAATCTPTPTVTDTPTPTPTCTPAPGTSCTPTATPTCDASSGVVCATSTPIDTATPTPTKTPVTIGPCPPLLTGVLIGTLTSGVSPASGTLVVSLSYSGTTVIGGATVGGGSGLPSDTITGTVACAVIRFTTASGTMRYAGTISEDGTSISGVYMAPPSAELRVGDGGTWQATLSTADTDGDGYPDVLEEAMNRDPNVYCGTMRADVNTDGMVTIGDLGKLASVFFQNVPPAPARYDQNADGKITIGDLGRQASVFGKRVSGCP
ncbi:MAG TPA: NHL repeat-containing protein [Dehalococcoidia bacterium]|nr:NHL repeat-containing protein [Dehalococcoidia bacterium]